MCKNIQHEDVLCSAGVKVSLVWPCIAFALYVFMAILGLVSLRSLWATSVIKLLIAAAFCTFCFTLGEIHWPLELLMLYFVVEVEFQHVKKKGGIFQGVKGP